MSEQAIENRDLLLTDEETQLARNVAAQKNMTLLEKDMITNIEFTNRQGQAQNEAQLLKVFKSGYRLIPSELKVLSEEEFDECFAKWSEATQGNISKALGNTYSQAIARAQIDKIQKQIKGEE